MVVRPRVVVNRKEVAASDVTRQVVNGKTHAFGPNLPVSQVVNGKRITAKSTEPAESTVNGVTYRGT
jgi:hypothetical protein